jgi:hypothetical protein
MEQINQLTTNTASTSTGEYLTTTFTSDLKSHSIALEYDFIRHEALVSEMNIKYQNPVELAILLKNIVNELKRYNIKHIIQQVSYSDWNDILKEHNIFQLVNENKIHGFYNVKCELERFPEAVMKALSFTDLFVHDSQ